MRAFIAACLLLTAGPLGAQPFALGDDLTADVILLGEVHDNPEHHANQAAWVAEMQPLALVFEMLTPDQALIAMAQREAGAEALGQALDWEASGWPDFAMYAPIFTAAPGAQIFGGAVGREVARAAVSDGAMAAMGPAGAVFLLDRSLPGAEQAAREEMQREAHCGALPEHLLPGMVEAQRLRDAAIARAVLAAIAETGGPVAVITGNGHARRDWGVPHALSLAAPELKVLSIGQGETGHVTVPGLHDRVAMAPPVPRGDPCDSLR